MSGRLVRWLVPLGFCLVLMAALVLPLAVLMVRSLSGPHGGLTLAHYTEYFATPGLTAALFNTLTLGALTVLVVLPLAFGFAYALERTGIAFKGPLTAIAAVPLLVPSLLPALALIYLFGHQGLLTPITGGTIYGFKGVLIADCIAVFPHALIILRTALSAADARLYEQAALFGASKPRTFWTITLPAARYGLVSAALVIFALTITDIGAPLVVGGDFDVLALVIYKQVLGQQHFELGAVAALLLMLPSGLAILAERIAAGRQVASLSARSQRLKADGPPGWGLAALAYGIAALLVIVLATCQLVALVKLWPYDMTLTADHYALDRYDGGGWSAVLDSVLLAAVTAVAGAGLAFTGAYASERLKGASLLRGLFARLALLPATVPGLALGLAYVLFFDDPQNPLHFVYGTAGILVLANVTHFYTVAHLTSAAAVKAIDPDLEDAAAMLGRTPFAVLSRIVAPMSVPALLEIGLYLFVNAMTTVSVVMFLYPPDFKLAAVAVLNMDDAGDLAPAAAMGMTIFYINLVTQLIGRGVLRALRTPSPRRIGIPAAAVSEQLA